MEKRAEPSYAYVSLWHRDSLYSPYMELALRVLHASLRASGSRIGMRVYVDESVTETERQALQDSGIEVHAMPGDVGEAPEMEDAEDARMLAHLWQKQVLWQMTDLSRVIYLDAHHTVLANMDRFFGCAFLCMLDSQTLVYYSDVMVVTPGHSPSLKAYRHALLEAEPGLVQQAMLPELQVLLLEAPLFDPVAPKFDFAPSGPGAVAGLRRLPPQVAVNHMMYYEKTSWRLLRCGELARASIPAWSVSYGYSIRVLGLSTYPWFWWSYAFFDVNNAWLQARGRLHEDFTSVGLPYVGALVVLAFGTTHLLLRRRLLQGLPLAVGASKFLAVRGLPRVLCALLCAFLVWACAMIAAHLIPYTLPPTLAWPSFLVLSNIFVYCTARLLQTLRSYRQLPVLIHGLVVRRVLAAFTIQATAYIALTRGQFPEFILKGVVLIGSIFLSWLLQSRTMYRAITNPTR